MIRTLMNRQRIFAITSIICGILGTWLIWYDSQSTIEAISELLEKVADTVGYWQDNPIPNEDRKAFTAELATASKLDKTGFVILMFSFVFQALTLIRIPDRVKKEVSEASHQE
ncbi:hypothetical protein [Ekhidna sp.]|jgi:hypothetical protein|uniref:hypothetical protein n=1 Tax=Ekhidna sp. TaxID=2608089 RepID=UPI0032EF572E